MPDIKLSPDITLLKKGVNMLWIKVLGVRVHITVENSKDTRAVMNRLMEQFKK